MIRLAGRSDPGRAGGLLTGHPFSSANPGSSPALYLTATSPAGFPVSATDFAAAATDFPESAATESAATAFESAATGGCCVSLARWRRAFTNVNAPTPRVIATARTVARRNFRNFIVLFIIGTATPQRAICAHSWPLVQHPCLQVVNVGRDGIWLQNGPSALSLP